MLKQSFFILFLGLCIGLMCTGALLFIGGLFTESWHALLGIVMSVGSVKLIDKLVKPQR